jgi:hypothetical protein
VLGLGVLAIAVGVASNSHAANQLYQGSLVVEAFGNDNVGGTLESEFFSVLGIPQGNLCNPLAPRCTVNETPFKSTMKGGPGTYKVFAPLGTQCTPIGYFGVGTRPAKGATATSSPASNVHYRNPYFFTGGGGPKTTLCTAQSTVNGADATVFLSTHDPDRGKAMKGAPLTGYQTINLTGTNPAGFTLPTAPPSQFNSALPFGFGMRRTTVGEFNNYPPYVYSYTYGTLRNDYGYFSSGGGPGSFTKLYKQGNNTVAQVKVQAGGKQFGGVMRMLGQLTVKVCYFRAGGCSLGENDWLYDAIGSSQTVLYSAKYYNTALAQTSTVMVIGERFAWTTGKVTLTAVGRGPHKTIERRKGYDNRTALGKGTIQLVSPVLTHWLQPATNFETGGIAILNLKFIPEPSKAMMLVAGLSVLTVLYRMRGR